MFAKTLPTGRISAKLTHAVLALVVALSTAACAVPHQRAYDQAIDACVRGIGPNACEQAEALSHVVAQEQAAQQQAADALSLSLFMMSQAMQHRPAPQPAVIYCPYGC
jgi:hypothetical protein